MARARNIKPGVMTNEGLSEIRPLARLLFIYLWMLADKSGRLEDRPKRIKAQALPYDNIEVEELLSELHRAGFLIRYTVENYNYIQIVNFEKHQNPHVREQASEIPSPVEVTAKAVTKHDQGSAEASPRSPDSLIPSSLIPDSISPELIAQDDDISTVPISEPPKDKPPSQRVSTVRHSHEDFELAEWMWEKIRLLYPEHKPPKLESWADDIRKMRMIDHKRIEDIRALFEWVNADDFWRAVVLSPSNLRGKWDRLAAQRSSRGPPTSGGLSKAGRETAVVLDAWIRRKEQEDVEEHAKLGS